MAHESEWSRQIAIAAEIRSKIWFGGLNWDPAGIALHLINAIVIVEIFNQKKKKKVIVEIESLKKQLLISTIKLKILKRSKKVKVKIKKCKM